MFGHRTLIFTLLLCSAPATQAGTLQERCIIDTIKTEVTEEPSSDLYRAKGITGGGIALYFNTLGKDILGRRKIVDEDPISGFALLSDGSGLIFDRDCRGRRCIYLGLQVVKAVNECPDWQFSDEDSQKRRRAFVVINTRNDSRLVRHLGDGRGRSHDETLIVASGQIVGFGVSLYAIHGGARNIDVVTRDAAGSLRLTTYVLDDQ